MDGVFEGADLLVGEGDVFGGGGEVGEDAFELKVFHAGEFVGEATEFRGKEAAAAHAGVHADVGVDFFAVEAADGVEVFRFFDAGDGGAPAVLDDDFAFRREAGAEDEDGVEHPAFWTRRASATVATPKKARFSWSSAVATPSRPCP